MSRPVILTGVIPRSCNFALMAASLARFFLPRVVAPAVAEHSYPFLGKIKISFGQDAGR